MNWRSLVEELHWVLITFIVYIIFVIHHNYKLDEYNKLIEGKPALEIMLYEAGASWKYLAFSFIYWRYRINIYENVNMILLLLFIFLIAVSFVFTIIYINNPILQAASVVVIGGAMSDSI